MLRKRYVLLALALSFAALPAGLVAQTAATPASRPAKMPKEMRESQVEIYRIVPGQQENFLRFLAKLDEANRMAGLPPRELYVHQDGASWDFVLIQPLHTTAEQDKAVYAAMTKLGLPHGADFFLEIRKYIVEHTDTATDGPTTAADWLNTMKK